MIRVTLYSKTGEEKKKVSLPQGVFGQPVNHRLLELVEKAFSANLRRGTASTKTRGDVRGGGKKPWRQKGTGRARHGSSRSPIWKGGGVAFGPHPRDYTVLLPKTMRDSALISALSLRAKEKNIFLLEEAKLKAPKTKEVVKILEALPLERKRTLCVLKAENPVLERASRNLSGLLKIKSARDLNAHHILQWPKLLIEEEALSVIEARLLGTAEEKDGKEEKSES